MKLVLMGLSMAIFSLLAVADEYKNNINANKIDQINLDQRSNNSKKYIDKKTILDTKVKIDNRHDNNDASTNTKKSIKNYGEVKGDLNQNDD